MGGLLGGPYGMTLWEGPVMPVGGPYWGALLVGPVGGPYGGP